MIEGGRAKVSVIIPNYNGASYLSACLGSLSEQSFKPLEIIVVDNGSSDRSIEVVRGFPQVKVIALSGNRGFAAAVNKGIEAAAGEYVLVLNNDTRADRDLVRELHDALGGRMEASMAAPKMLFLRDPSVVNSAGLGYCITGTNHDIGFGRKDGPDFAESVWVFGPSGGAGMYRRELFRDTGGFDEDFFMYYEDVDLSFRAQLKGYRCIYVPSARVYHAEGGSSSVLRRPKNYFFARNSLLVVVKDFPASILLRYWPVIVWEMLKRAASPLLRGDFWAFWGYCSAIGSVRQYLAKRRAVQGSAKVSPRDIEALLLKNRSVREEIDIDGRPCEGRS